MSDEINVVSDEINVVFDEVNIESIEAKVASDEYIGTTPANKSGSCGIVNGLT